MAQFHSHFLTLRKIFSPLLLLLIFVLIIHPSHGDEPLRGGEIVDEICSRTSDKPFCVNTIIPDPRLSSGDGETAIGIANITLDLATVRTDEAGRIILTLLNDSSSPYVEARELDICWFFSIAALTDLWVARNNFVVNNINDMVKYLNYVAYDAKICQDNLQGTSFSNLAANYGDIIKLCEICVVSTKFFYQQG